MVNVAELKIESDYRAQLVKSFKEEVAAEQKKADEAKGTDDEDLFKRQAEVVIEWFNQGLEEQKEIATDALA